VARPCPIPTGPLDRRAGTLPAMSSTSSPSLVERLGHPAGARLVIIHADDLGMTRSSNVGAYDVLRGGLATSASLMVPCPWARDAAATYRGEDVGVHLTLLAEWDTYRWGPITHSPSLVDGSGGFPRSHADLFDHADPAEVRKECRAQIERAVWWGFDVTHLTSHLGTLLLRPEYFDAYLELALEFGLPARLAAESAERNVGFPFRKIAASEGLVFPDHVVHADRGLRRTLEQALVDLPPGVTEVVARPGLDTDELRAACDDWPARVEDHALLRDDRGLAELLDRTGAVLVGWRDLRDLQRRA
jgi:chitin disaccharide deacetylase